MREHYLGLASLAEQADILHCLETMYRNWEKGTITELRKDVNLDLEMYSREFQNAKYLKILNNSHEELSPEKKKI